MHPLAPNPPMNTPRVLSEAPAELTRARLRRLGEGVGKVVYASENWVVKRERSPSEIVALIVVWKGLRRFERVLPRRISRRLIDRPARQIRYLRVLAQAGMLIAPKSVWFSAHVRDVWKIYRSRVRRGELLAMRFLEGTELIPERVTFPPVRVKVSGWPGWLTVSEATERVEATLDQRLADLAAFGRYDEVERWLNGFLDLRQAGWRRGLFSLDAHLKNFGVHGDRVVLIDTGGLTNRWSDVAARLDFEDVVAQPHIQLGLGKVLAGRPDIAARFNARWKAIVSHEGVRKHWPDSETLAAS